MPIPKNIPSAHLQGKSYSFKTMPGFPPEGFDTVLIPRFEPKETLSLAHFVPPTGVFPGGANIKRISPMPWIQLLALALAAGLTVYLTIALVKPEWFE